MFSISFAWGKCDLYPFALATYTHAEGKIEGSWQSQSSSSGLQGHTTARFAHSRCTSRKKSAWFPWWLTKEINPGAAEQLSLQDCCSNSTVH